MVTISEALDDQAIYRRTAAGQRELVDPNGLLSPVERQFLGIVTGLTPLRVLLDLGVGRAGIGPAILSLADRRLIELDNG